MRRQRGLVGLTGLAALVGLGLIARPALAQRKTVVTTEQSASILVFPKVIADGTRDTIIQITIPPTTCGKRTVSTSTARRRPKAYRRGCSIRRCARRPISTYG